jgi:hypothetical protein
LKYALKKCFITKRKKFFFYCNNAHAAELQKSGKKIFTYEQTESEIYADLIKIRELLLDKLVAITGHITPPLELLNRSNAEKLWDVRNELRRTLSRICSKIPSITFIDASDILEELSSGTVFAPKVDGPSGCDINHYNPKSFVAIGQFFEQRIKPSILIATPGKVGTVTMVKLFKSTFNTSVLPNHNLNVLKDAIFKRSKLQGNNSTPLKVITGVRHPLDFLVSAFCQIVKAGRLQHLAFDSVDQYLEVFEYEAPKIIDNYFSWLSKYLYLSQVNNDLDRLQHSIKHNGYYKSELNSFNVNFFIYRFEDLISDTQTFDALKSFGLLENEVEMVKENSAPKEGVLGELYYHLKSEVGTYQNIVNTIRHSNIYGLFYTDKEIADNLKKYKVGP